MLCTFFTAEESIKGSRRGYTFLCRQFLPDGRKIMLKKMRNSKLIGKERKAIVDFRNKILSRFKNKILLIKVFGSKVRGNAKKESDIDVLVVYKGDGKIKDYLLNIEWEILKKYNYNVYLSVILYSFKEYKYDCKIQTPFIYNVNKEGVILWNTID